MSSKVLYRPKTVILSQQTSGYAPDCSQ